MTKKKDETQPQDNKVRDAVFHPEFREDLAYWVETNRKTALRAFNLVEAIMRDPFTGIGKPEPLKYLDSNAWSRRLTQEHRIVYLVSDDRMIFFKLDIITENASYIW